MGNVNQNNIKNRTFYFFNDMINIKNFDSNLLKIDKRSHKKIGIYHIGYATQGFVQALTDLPLPQSKLNLKLSFETQSFKDTINLCYCLLKNANFSIKKSNI